MFRAELLDETLIDRVGWLFELDRARRRDRMLRCASDAKTEPRSTATLSLRS